MIELLINGLFFLCLLEGRDEACQTTTNNTSNAAQVRNWDTLSCKIIDKANDIYVNCSSRNLVFVPVLPLYATSINLSNNQISMIFNPGVFSGMWKLRELDLSDNPLQFIQQNIFRGLSSLTILYLRNTLLYKQKLLILDSLLCDLYQLQHFSFTFEIPKNTRVCPLPCTFRHKSQPFGKVDTLKAIKSLEIDTSLLKWPSNTTSLGVIFLTNQLHLINGFFCYYGQINSALFAYMPVLEILQINNPYSTRIITDDFMNSNKHLQQLKIYGLNEPFGNIIQFIYNVTASISNLSNITTLILEDTASGMRKVLHCSYESIYNLTGLHSLINLSLAGNNLSFDEFEPCDQFPTSIKYIDLQRNCITISEINHSILQYNEQVEIINARDQSNCAFMFKRNVQQSIHRSKTDTSVSHSPKRDQKTTTKYKLERFIFTNSTAALHFGYVYDMYPRLKFLDLSLNNKASRTVVPNFFSKCRPNMQYLNMSDCSITELKTYSFSRFNKLEVLDLSFNMLGNMGCELTDRISNLRSLRYLNLAKNGISCVESYSFKAMGSIRKIDLSGNEIQLFDATLAHAKNLEHLDLSENRLKRLSERNMKELNELATTHSMTLDLSGNILLCTCDTLRFVRWMRDTSVNLFREEKYVCTLSDGKDTSLKYIDHIISNLTSQCSSKIPLALSISAVISCCLATLCSILVYSFRWRMRYWYYKTKIKVPYRPSKHGYDQLFEYDIFISYSSEDNQIARDGTLHELETVRGLRTCIHERDFKPGESIAFNISKGIHNSKRTLMFISKAFLASEWCMYELNIARMEALHTGRKVILVVMLENIPCKSMPVDVLDIIDAYTYIEYPKDGTEIDLKVFWSKYADFAYEN